MNWKIKAHILAALSRLPAGHHLYHRLQKWLGTNRLGLAESISRSAEMFSMIRHARMEVEGKVCLEVGTGWRPLLPSFLFLAGAKRIFTFDVHRWLDLSYARETYQAVRDHVAEIVDKLGLDEITAQERLQATAGCKLDTLDNILQALQIEYRCPADAGHTGLPEKSVDIVVSTNVLEHINPHDLRRIHAEAYRLLVPGGLAVHRVDVGDHFATIDRRITTGNFLQFSEEDWRWYGGSGLSYHNRLRCTDHVRLLEEAGFDEVRHQVRVDEVTSGAIKDGSLAVSAGFGGHNIDDLAGSFLWMTGFKSAIRPEKYRAAATAGKIF